MTSVLSHMELYTVRKVNWWRYCLDLCDEIFDHFPLFDETLRHKELCKSVVSQLQLNPPKFCLTVYTLYTLYSTTLSQSNSKLEINFLYELVYTVQYSMWQWLYTEFEIHGCFPDNISTCGLGKFDHESILNHLSFITFLTLGIF